MSSARSVSNASSASSVSSVSNVSSASNESSASSASSVSSASSARSARSGSRATSMVPSLFTTMSKCFIVIRATYMLHCNSKESSTRNTNSLHVHTHLLLTTRHESSCV